MPRLSFTLTTSNNRYNFGIGRKPEPRVEVFNDRAANVVVLGAGYAGAACARSLAKSQQNIKITVVDQRLASIHKIGGVRAAVLGDKFAHRVAIPNDKLVPRDKGVVLHKGIRKVTDSEVVLDDGTSIGFDYLVCATGARNIGPGEPPSKMTQASQMMLWYSKIASKIRDAENVAIIGGGAVGVEMAGEIKYEYPNKSVCLIHSGSSLLDSFDPPVSSTFQKALLSKLKKLGVFLYLGERADLSLRDFKNRPFISGRRTVETDLGSRIQADLIILCSGTRLNNKMYPDSWLDVEQGTISVRPTLQLDRLDNVFAIGDISSIKENKQGFFAAKQGELAAKNIKSMMQNNLELARYKPGLGTGKTFVFVPLGPRSGVSHAGYATFGSTVTRLVKGKWLFTKRQWKVYNQGQTLMADTSSYDRKRRIFSAGQRREGNGENDDVQYRENEQAFKEAYYDDAETEYPASERYRLTPPKARRRKAKDKRIGLEDY